MSYTITTDIDINASKEAVWDVLVDFAQAGTLLTERLFHGRHTFTLVANPDGTTRVLNHEEFSGFLTTLTQRFMKQTGDNGYTAFNEGLKREVEGRTTLP